MKKAFKILFNLGLVLAFIIFFSAEARAENDAPKITKVAAEAYFSLSGTASTESVILIYLDGNFFGQAEAIFSCAGSIVAEAECQPSWNFQFDSAQKLTDGVHAVMAVAQDKVSLILSAPTEEIKFTVNAVPAPTLIAPNEKTATADPRPLITGLAKDNSSVEIFIDGVYNGGTGVLNSESGTANFSFRSTMDLGLGWHKIQARAMSAGATSLDSNIINFEIQLPMPAPTMFRPVVNRETSLSRPFIVGLAKNDSKIKIYIDKKYNGELTVKNHISGTANFAYKPVVALARGTHSVYTVAVDKRGKESIGSNLVNFFTKNSAIAQSAKEERKEAVAKIKEPKKPAEVKTEPVIISESSGAVLKTDEVEPTVEIKEPVSVEKTAPASGSLKEKEQAIKQSLRDKEKAAIEKVKGLIGAGAAETKSDRGMINEGKQNQGRLKLDLILFILFLVGVVAWLLWVNRELVKERRAQTEAEELFDAEALAKKKAEESNNYQPGRGRENKLF